MTPSPRITYDPSADALSIILEAQPSGRLTTKLLASGIHADYIGERLVGLEILDASHCIDPGVLSEIDSPVQMLTMSEAAAESRRQPTTLRSAIAAGRLAAEKRGRDWMIPRHALWNYLENLAPAGRPTADRKAPRRTRTKA